MTAGLACYASMEIGDMTKGSGGVQVQVDGCLWVSSFSEFQMQKKQHAGLPAAPRDLANTFILQGWIVNHFVHSLHWINVLHSLLCMKQDGGSNGLGSEATYNLNVGSSGWVRGWDSERNGLDNRMKDLEGSEMKTWVGNVVMGTTWAWWMGCGGASERMVVTWLDGGWWVMVNVHGFHAHRKWWKIYQRRVRWRVVTDGERNAG